MPERTVTRICPLCEAACGLQLTFAGDRVVDVSGNPDDLFSQGYLCPKGANLGRLDQDPDRLTAPLVRRDGVLREATWEEAFAAVAEGLERVRTRYGDDAVAIYAGNPNAHTLAATPYLPSVIRSLGTRNFYSAATLDQMPTEVAVAALYGTVHALPVPDVDRTDYLLMFGANPIESNGSGCSAPNMPARLRALRDRGTLVVVDPRRTRSARLAQRHLAVRPNTDPHLLLGLVHTLFDEDLVHLDALADLVDGVEDLRRVCAPFRPEDVSAVCGVPAAEIRTVAREFAAAPRAAAYGRIGICTVAHGTLTNWLIQALNVLTGNLDRVGGMMFPVNPVVPAYRPHRPFRHGRWHSRVKGHPEMKGEFPTATLADEMETPGEGRVRALVTVAGNPVLSAPNGPRLAAAMVELDFMVSVDPWLNETTAHADVVLPPPPVLTAGHFDWVLAANFVRAVVRYSPPVLPAQADRPTEGDILLRLAAIASGRDDSPTSQREALVQGMLRKAVDDPASPVAGRDAAELRAMLAGRTGIERHLEVQLRLGPFGDGFGADPDGLTFAALLEHPEGVDFGPMRPRLGDLLCHPDHRIKLCPPQFGEGAARLMADLTRPREGFVMIGRRRLRSNNSWMHNVANLVSGPDACTVQINTGDADELGLGEGDAVRMTSSVGSVVATAEITDDLPPGVVSLPHGWGHDTAGTRLSVAALVAGVNANALTDDKVLEPYSGTAVFNGVPVHLAPSVTGR